MHRLRLATLPSLLLALLALLALPVLLALSGASAPLRAQGTPRLEVTLPEQPAQQPPRVQVRDPLASGRLRDLLRSGFPARLHYRVELWSTGGLLNDLEGSAEWDVIVRYDQLEKRYEVARVVDDRVTLLGTHLDVAGAQRAVERPFHPIIRIPRGGRRYYYSTRLELETLSLSDLDEVQRWLRGELRPAVRGERNPGTALGRGVGRLFVRIVGGERMEMQARSGTFYVQ